MKFQENVRIVKGTVVDENDQRYSSTHVSGGDSYTNVSNGVAYTTTTPVSSSVSHHQVQKIWITDDAGVEDNYQFHDRNIDVRPGH